MTESLERDRLRYERPQVGVGDHVVLLPARKNDRTGGALEESRHVRYADSERRRVLSDPPPLRRLDDPGVGLRVGRVHQPRQPRQLQIPVDRLLARGDVADGPRGQPGGSGDVLVRPVCSRAETRALAQYVDVAVDELEPGLERLLEGNRAFLRWSMLNRGLAPLLFWRPIPGFEPSPESYALAEELVARARADLSEAVRQGDLDESADSEDAFRLLTTLGAGIAWQQLANQPGATFETGVFTSLTDRALDMFVQQYAPRRSRGTSSSPKRNR